ncbi:alpha-L-fucosidase [Carboxylicivirga marina]|uniref:alpha-L-fucosidase n=1 Tax=Carboxylicivirga marina TaxID=2800988 RepID=A0ABS1HQ07_9BACT|nr:alpha-L-fucosidase [Carboxylicivirga marina]MBK3519244.1 alpha-L-fucosidase [Carboxylicivirga marina]
MKLKISLAAALLAALTLTQAQDKKPERREAGFDWDRSYSEEWEEMKKYPIPEWMIDAKFGIYTHWGIYSVPAHGGPDYVKEMYKADPEKSKRGTAQYHINKYGPVAEFGYKDFLPMFNTPKFDAKEWVDVMESGGVKFAGICLSHHDGFALWDSKHSDYNSVNYGPKRDIYGEIAAEVKKRDDIKLAATFHMARTYGYMYDNDKNYSKEQKQTWDIFDPEYAHMYKDKSVLSKEDFAAEWSGKVREVIDNYSPDVLWFDGLSGSIKNDEVPEDSIVDILKYYYKKGFESGDSVVVCSKLPGTRVWNFPLGFGLRCYENCRDMEEDPQGYWLADRAISYPWCYVNDKQYKHRAPYHIRSLVDMTSRGGIFFLSLTPKGDGSIPDEEKEIMKNMGDWLSINGEAIYATRRYKTAGEGTTEMLVWSKGKNRYKWDFTALNAEDVRFTRSKDLTSLYATVLGVPESKTYTIKTLDKGKKLSTGGGIESISMLGSDATIKWEETEEGLKIYFPEVIPNDIACSFKIIVKGKLVM